MCDSDKKFVHLLGGLLLVITFRHGIVEAKGGHCWSVVNSNGRCTQLLDHNSTHHDCCADGRATTAFSAPDLSSGELFYQLHFRGGVACEPCRQPGSSCQGVVCGHGQRCQERPGGSGPRCVCEQSPTACTRKRRKMGAVCGTDGVSYVHECRLAKRKCRKDASLDVAYHGPCQDSCEQVTCQASKFCVRDQNQRPHCIKCKLRCGKKTTKLAPVCGSNGVTYKSKCHLQKAACAQGKAMEVVAATGPGGSCHHHQHLFNGTLEFP